MKKVLITSALPYANGPLHFGHIAGAYLPGDCYARFQRLIGNETLYICGSDEYGVAITMSADIAGRTPKEQVDLFHEVNLNLFKKLHFSFDHYSRTTWKGHAKPVQQYFLDLLHNGYIEEKETDQLYSEKDKKFLADRYVIGTCPKCGFDKARGDECPKCGSSYEATDLKNPRSKLTDAPLVLKKTKHWFLMLDKFKDRLITWLDSKNWKPNVVNFVKSYIKDLRPRAITRDSEWGVPIPLPNTEGKVLYVWFDAPIGYISATMEWSDTKWKDYWCDPETKLVNFVGKDNIPFHAAIFPAMTMGQNLPLKLVDELPANEFYMLEGRQFSKSDGWAIDLEDFFSRYTPDQIRYTIAANAPETADAEFTWKDFQNRCNSELLGKYGNLINRTLVFAQKKCDLQVPKMENLEEIDQKFLTRIKELVNQAYQNYDQFSLRKATHTIMELAGEGNVYFDSKKPWKADPQSMNNTIACSLECIKALALISYPIIPNTAEKVWSLLGVSKSFWQDIVNTPLKAGQKLNEPVILFTKIEDEQITEELKKLKSMTENNTATDNQITIDQFKSVDLRVATILEAEPIEKSKKLYKLRVDIGTEQRTIVSGIREYFQPQDLIGKKVIVVANLKPVVLMGVESHGMLLCAKSDTTLEMVRVETVPPGTEVT